MRLQLESIDRGIRRYHAQRLGVNFWHCLFDRHLWPQLVLPLQGIPLSYPDTTLNPALRKRLIQAFHWRGAGYRRRAHSVA